MMKLPTTKMICATAATILVTALALGEQLRADSGDHEMRRGAAIRGTWDSVVTLRACNADVTLRKFRALNLFERDGALVATSEVAQPPSLGKWQWLGGNRYRATFRFQRFGAGSVFEGVNEVTREIELAASGNQFSSAVSIATFDIYGTLIATGCAKEEATRVY